MKELTLEITNYCAATPCSWCSSNSTTGWDAKPMSYQKVFGLLAKYRRECDVVRLSGGEPTSHPKIDSIIEYAKKLGYKVVLLTNGWNPPSDTQLALVDEFVVSAIDKRSLATVATLKLLRKNVSMHTVLVAGNEEHISDAVAFSLKEKVPLRLLALQKQGKATLNSHYIKPLALLTWTGDKGCTKGDKITITWDGKEGTCSAFKSKLKEECDCLGSQKDN